MQRREFLLTSALTAAVPAGLFAAGNAAVTNDITSLHEAAEKNNVEAITALLKAGADVNAKDIFGGSSLYYAEVCDNTEAVAVLRKAGAKQV